MTVSQVEHDRIIKDYASQVNHRANNLLAVIQGLIRMSEADDVARYKGVIEGRVMALAQAHSLISAGNWESIPMRDLINCEMMNFVDVGGPQLNVIGDEISLPAPRAQNAAMIIHELATNARAYGSLRFKEGRVTVQWTLQDDGMRYEWVEDGCDDVEEPKQEGTGLRLVRSIIRSTNAKIKIDWRKSGVFFSFLQPYDYLRPKPLG